MEKYNTFNIILSALIIFYVPTFIHEICSNQLIVGALHHKYLISKIRFATLSKLFIQVSMLTR